MRVVIRRPHAYEFLSRIQLDPMKSIPGIVFLDADGEVRGMVPMMAANARERLLEMMAKLGS